MPPGGDGHRTTGPPPCRSATRTVTGRYSRIRTVSITTMATTVCTTERRSRISAAAPLYAPASGLTCAAVTAMTGAAPQSALLASARLALESAGQARRTAGRFTATRESTADLREFWPGPGKVDVRPFQPAQPI